MKHQKKPGDRLFLFPPIINSDDCADFITRHIIETLSGRDYELSILCNRSLNVEERKHLDMRLNFILVCTSKCVLNSHYRVGYLYVQASVHSERSKIQFNFMRFSGRNAIQDSLHNPFHPNPLITIGDMKVFTHRNGMTCSAL